MHDNLHKKLTALLNLVKAINDDQRSGQKSPVIIRRPAPAAPPPFNPAMRAAPTPSPESATAINPPAAQTQPIEGAAAALRETPEEFQERKLQEHVNGMHIEDALRSEHQSVRDRAPKRPDFKDYVESLSLRESQEHPHEAVVEAGKKTANAAIATGLAEVEADAGARNQFITKLRAHPHWPTLQAARHKMARDNEVAKKTNKPLPWKQSDIDKIDAHMKKIEIEQKTELDKLMEQIGKVKSIKQAVEEEKKNTPKFLSEEDINSLMLMPGDKEANQKAVELVRNVFPANSPKRAKIISDLETQFRKPWHNRKNLLRFMMQFRR